VDITRSPGHAGRIVERRLRETVVVAMIALDTIVAREVALGRCQYRQPETGGRMKVASQSRRVGRSGSELTPGETATSQQARTDF
jgi:hypothetical protein